MLYFSSAQTQLDDFAHRIQIDHFLSNEECSKVIALMPDRKLTEALISEQGVKNTSIRSTRLCALDFNKNTEWIFRKLEGAIMQVNREAFHLEILGFGEPLQLMIYRKDDHYGWHMDTGSKQFSVRKISLSVQLSDPEDYEGGDLEFFNTGFAEKKKGTLILFQSYLYHRITPVTKGLRRSLVGWTTGQFPLK